MKKGVGGLGGGGAGTNVDSATATAGTDDLGGGGGGCPHFGTAGRGGSGVVILRYKP